MPSDYKGRSTYNQRTPRVYKVLGIGVFVSIIFIFIGFFLFQSEDNENQQVLEQNQSLTIKQSKPTPPAEPKEPQYDFYIVLPEKEIIVPEYQINTRKRAETFKPSKKTSHYIVQAGSFKSFAEADKRLAKITLLGIKAQIVKAKVGQALWYRVQMGAYKKAATIAVIKKHLKASGIDAIVMEISEK